MTQKMTPRITAGQINCGRLVIGTSSAQREGDREDGADGTAVDGERGEAVGLEEAQEELHGEIGGHRGAERADQSLTTDVVALGSEQLRQLENARGPDDRGGQQKGEAR